MFAYVLRKRSVCKNSSILWVAWLLFSGSIGEAQAGSAEKVFALRQQVDELAQRLAAERRETQDELRALRAEKNEMDRRVRLERVRARTLHELSRQSQQQALGMASKMARWVEPAKRAFASTRAYIAARVPYRQSERSKKLRDIEMDLLGPKPNPGRAITRLWRFIEEEEALASEIAVDRQAIHLAGRDLLVEVVRIGAALLYFRTESGLVGWAKNLSEGWQFDLISHPLGQKIIQGLFATFAKNRRFGPMTLWLPALEPLRDP